MADSLPGYMLDFPCPQRPRTIKDIGEEVLPLQLSEVADIFMLQKEQVQDKTAM